MGIKKYFLVKDNSYVIGIGTFWAVIPVVCAVAFFSGTIKYDLDKIDLYEENKALKDTIKIREKKIELMIHYSDSAHQILGHMPYDEMKLDTLEFRKVQTNIETAGKVLILNK